MDKAGLLKSIATTGYNVGFGAKKHFSTLDIVEKAPGWIGFISTAAGIGSLVIDILGSKGAAAALAILGSCTVYINGYRSKEYDAAGRTLTQIYNQLRDLYYAVQGGADLPESKDQLKSLEATYYEAAISKQILFSDWLAHYKFFAQQERTWINEQRQFTWKDMVPLSLRVALVLVIGLGFLSGFFLWGRTQ